jgi:hypothetical protein
VYNICSDVCDACGNCVALSHGKSKLLTEISEFNRKFVLTRFNPLSVRDSTRIGLIFDHPEANVLCGKFKTGSYITIELLDLFIKMCRERDSMLQKCYQERNKNDNRKRCMWMSVLDEAQFLTQGVDKSSWSNWRTFAKVFVPIVKLDDKGNK